MIEPIVYRLTRMIFCQRFLRLGGALGFTGMFRARFDELNREEALPKGKLPQPCR